MYYSVPLASRMIVGAAAKQSETNFAQAHATAEIIRRGDGQKCWRSVLFFYIQSNAVRTRHGWRMMTIITHLFQ